MRLASHEHDDSRMAPTGRRRVHGSLFVALADYAERATRRRGRHFDTARIAALRTFGDGAWYPDSTFQWSAWSLFEACDGDARTEIAAFAAELAARDVANVQGLRGAGPELTLLALPLFFSKYADRGGPTLRSLERGRACIEFGAAPSTDPDPAGEHPICIGIRAWLGSALSAAGALRVRVEPTTSAEGPCPRSLEVHWDAHPGAPDFFRSLSSSFVAGALDRVEETVCGFRLLYAAFSERDETTLVMERVYGPRKNAPPSLPAMTLAERDVLDGLLAGAADAEIALRRASSTKTVSNQVRSIFAKLGVRSRRELWARYGTK